jgi:histidinol-phosphate aminotransferase
VSALSPRYSDAIWGSCRAAPLHPHVPGEQPPAGTRLIKLNTNENPYPPSPHVAEAVRAELDAGAAPGERLRPYSDPNARAVCEAAARRYGLPASQVLAGNG